MFQKVAHREICSTIRKSLRWVKSPCLVTYLLNASNLRVSTERLMLKSGSHEKLQPRRLVASCSLLLTAYLLLVALYNFHVIVALLFRGYVREEAVLSVFRRGTPHLNGVNELYVHLLPCQVYPTDLGCLHFSISLTLGL